MHKATKIILFTVLGLPLVALLAVSGFFLLKDANDFKPAIEAQAKSGAGVNLAINGDLSWSLIPLGLDIHQISIKDQELQDFASADRIMASIDFWSLFSGTPKVATILLDGLQLNLIQYSETKNNWSKVLPEKQADSSASPPRDQSTQSETNPNTDLDDNQNTQAGLNFLIESFQLINTKISFESKVEELFFTIDPLNLTLTNITFDQAFPISLNFVLSEKKNQLKVKSELSAQLTMSQDLTLFELSQLENTYHIKAPEFISDELRLAVNAEVRADTNTETVAVSSLMLALNQLRLNAEATIENYSSELKVQASLEAPAFSLKKLLADLEINLPEMQAEDALDKLALSGSISLDKQQLTIDEFKLLLDESSWKGTISHLLAEQPGKQASSIKLQGDKLNLDRYLPPPNNNQETEQAASAPQTPASDATSELLPLETLRNLNLEFALLQDSLQVNNIETTQVFLSVKAKDGKLEQKLTGQLYDGSYELNNRLNTQSQTPQWVSEQSINKVNLAPIMKALNIEQLKEYGSIAGILNIQGSLKASGNQLTALKSSASGKLDFNIDQGAFEGISLNTLTCQGLALINKESIDTSSWPNATPFHTLKGSATIDKQLISTQFDIITSGIHASSQGQINLDQSALTIKAALKVIGESVDQACRVNDKLKDVGIPVICKGQFDTPPAELCKLDTSRLAGMAKDLAVEEGKRKLNKEVDRALEKHLGDDEKAPVKSLLKKLLK